MSEGLVIWFKNEAYYMGDISSSLTIDDLIKELKEAKNKIGGDKQVFLGSYDGNTFGKITPMRITREYYYSKYDVLFS